MTRSGPTLDPKRLGTHAERATERTARIAGLATTLLAATVAIILHSFGISLLVSGPAALGLGYWAYVWFLGPLRRRQTILQQEFPPAWEEILSKEVLFYRALDPDDRRRFQRELQIFLGEKRITGIGTEVDTTTRILAAASAIIPIFGYTQWEWDQIAEILIYPGRFNEDFESKEGQNILGMVGSGAMNRIMVLSKPDLLEGFRNPGDKQNVGLHEFAHLVDKSDGKIDGIPAGMNPRAIGPWIELMHREMSRIEAGESDIRPYALTNEGEFFAVVTEYFFERPDLMQRKHPELFATLEKVFRQDLKSRLLDFARERSRQPRSIGRNAPCPCGSGEKYKHCCLGRN